MTGLENLNAKAMLVDKEGDFWYYDGTRVYCIVEGGIAVGVAAGVSIEYAERWAPFTQLMAADWANCLEEACATSDAAERELEDRNKELLEVYDSLVALYSLIKEWDENGFVNISEVAYPFPEAKALLAARKIALNAPRVERSKPGDGLTPADPGVVADKANYSIPAWDLTQGALFKDRFGDTWRCDRGYLYLVIVEGVGQRGTTAVDPNGLVIQRYKPLIKLAPQNEQGNGITLPDSNMHTVVTALEPEPEDGDLYMDIEGDVWLFDRGVYVLLTVAGMRANPGVEHPDDEMAEYKPLIRLVPGSKT